MEVEREIAGVRAAIAALKRPLGFVPTMGALHAGHVRLVERSKERCASCVVSLFVNPLQFGADEDLDRYPRDFAGDCEKLSKTGVDLLFAPEHAAMYPHGFATSVDVGDLGRSFEGTVRPMHFRGVATVVTKLLHIVQPDVLLLGQKDAQQTAVLGKLVRDLNFDVQLEVVPTAREEDGLALSSRNVYLSAGERAAAPSLHAALLHVHGAIVAGTPMEIARAEGRALLQAPGEWQYLDVVDAQSFEPLQTLRAPAFVIGAARFGRTRLIDNVLVAA